MLRALRKDWAFFLFLLLQIGTWLMLRQASPDFSIVPEPPTETTVKATSFGDEEMYFRLLAYQIQNAGDSYGRITPLKDYNYKKLYQWWLLLDTLNSRSHFVPALAAYYYSNTQHRPDVYYVVDYLEQYADKDPVTNWWWYAQASFNANYKLNNKNRALVIAEKLAKVENPGMPIWTRQLPAFILADMGQLEQSAVIIETLLKEYKEKGTLNEGEINFMNYYINEQLDAIKARNEQQGGGTPEGAHE
jgi:hypothetical protein